MRPLTSAFLFVLILYSSCSNYKTSETNSENKSEVTEEPSCFAAIFDQDSIILHLKINQKMVSGDLQYNFFEKDDNTGTIEGMLVGDTVFATYSFKSEGILSVREVAFLKRGDSFIEGFGEVEDKEGMMVFRNRRSLKFNEVNIFQPVDCLSDEKGCVGIVGYKWSGIKGNCVKLLEHGIRMNAIGTDDIQKTAFILFSDDQSKAELFLPNKTVLIMERQGEEGSHFWTNKDLKLYPWKGYVLKKDDKVVYAGN